MLYSILTTQYPTLFMLLLGLDIGTSSIKATVVNAATQQTVASAQYPDYETPISSPQLGWAEQDPQTWWQHVVAVILRLNATQKYDPNDIAAIGIAYQMHGLVLVDKAQNVLRPSIIWCDSRAVEIGNRAFGGIGSEQALARLLNSPGNFTAAKLGWVKENEPALYDQIDRAMLPGDFIAMRLTGQATSSNSGLSEGIFWDFQSNEISKDIMDYFGFEDSILSSTQPVFSNHGQIKASVAQQLGLPAGISVTYKAGDQPNNALSLNVLEPGEIAATAGTSGVLYAVSGQVAYDPQSRVNTFAHVNHRLNPAEDRLGILLCINGTGILNRWVKDNLAGGLSYADMNQRAAQVGIGSEGLSVLPFGNGAERVLGNKSIGGQLTNIHFNTHTNAHIFRAVQEGIAFSFQYGFDIMQRIGVQPQVIRAGQANLFLSDVFTEALVNVTNAPVELFDTDGSKGAALGAGIGLGYFKTPKEAFEKLTKLKTIEPNPSFADAYQSAYQNWLARLSLVLGVG